MARVDAPDAAQAPAAADRVGDRRELPRRGARRHRRGRRDATRRRHRGVARRASSSCARPRRATPSTPSSTRSSRRSPTRASSHARREVLHRKVARDDRARSSPTTMPGRTRACSRTTSARAARSSAPRSSSSAPVPRPRARPRPSEALHFFEEASKLYLEIHKDGGDPAKRALLERNIARGALLSRPLPRRDRALQRGAAPARRPRRRRAARSSGCSFARESRRGAGPPLRPRWRPASRGRDDAAMRDHGPPLRARRGRPSRRSRRATSFDSMDTLAFLQRIDPRGGAGRGQVLRRRRGALRVRRPLLRRRAAGSRERARALVADRPVDEYIYERAMHFTYRVLEGDWSDEHEIDPATRSPRASATASSGGRRPISACSARSACHRGDFAGARACIAEIDRIWDLFQYDLAKTNYYYLHTLLAARRRRLRPRRSKPPTRTTTRTPRTCCTSSPSARRRRPQTELGALDAAEETLGLRPRS